MAIAWAVPTAEAREALSRIDIAAKSLPEAVAEISREAAVSIGTEGVLPHIRTRAIHGRMSVGEALARLLAGSGFSARQVGANAWRIERAPASAVAAPEQTHSVALVEAAPIIVTAGKRDQSLGGLPMALALVEPSGPRGAMAGSDTAWAAAGIEGLSLTALGPGRNRMFLRGIADSPFNGESQSTVAVLLDDARLTYAAPDPDIRLVDVQRVEVLKGPQGSLYGTGVLGGIYHIVTNRADLEESSLAVSAGVEAIARGDSGFSGSAIANVPLATGRAALRLVGYAAREPGWVDSGAREDGNSSRLLGTRAGLGLDPGGGWRVDATGFAQWLESQDSRYVYAPRSRTRPAQLAEPHDNDLAHISLRAARSGNVDIVLSIGKTWHQMADTLDATVGAESFGLADPQLLNDARQYRVWDNEARLSGMAGPVNWLFGLSYIRTRQSNLWTLESGSGATLAIDDNRRTASDNAAFGEATLPLLTHVKLTLGARLFRSSARETRVLATETVTRRSRRDGMIPSAAVAWQPQAGRLIFLRYGSAYRQGGTDIGPSGNLEDIKSDELASVEAGWRETLAGGSKLELGLHHAWWDNLQSDVLLSNGLIETKNAGDAQIWGAEFSLDLPFGETWRGQAGATYTAAHLVRSTLGFTLEDRDLPVVPKYTLRGAIEHDFALGHMDASLRFQLRYSGPARLSFDPALDRPMGNVLESRIEAHAALNGLEFTLAAENIFNRKSDTFAFGNSLRFATMRQYTPQHPPQLSIAVLRHF